LRSRPHRPAKVIRRTRKPGARAMNALLLVLVLGAVLIALVVDATALWEWLTRERKYDACARRRRSTMTILLCGAERTTKERTSELVRPSRCIWHCWPPASQAGMADQ